MLVTTDCSRVGMSSMFSRSHRVGGLAEDRRAGLPPSSAMPAECGSQRHPSVPAEAFRSPRPAIVQKAVVMLTVALAIGVGRFTWWFILRPTSGEWGGRIGFLLYYLPYLLAAAGYFWLTLFLIGMIYRGRNWARFAFAACLYLEAAWFVVGSFFRPLNATLFSLLQVIPVRSHGVASHPATAIQRGSLCRACRWPP